jgi:hypothetical protein
MAAPVVAAVQVLCCLLLNRPSAADPQQAVLMQPEGSLANQTIPTYRGCSDQAYNQQA